MSQLNGFSAVTANTILQTTQYGTPVYLYDEAYLVAKCREVLAMPHAFGFQVRYAMKANSNRTILRLIAAQGIAIDASSLNEAKRAIFAGIAPDRIMLTTQEIPLGKERSDLEDLMRQGMKYNLCSLRQLELIVDFAAKNSIGLSLRLHPGVGAGESASRNTGDEYSCFGIHLSDLPQALQLAAKQNVRFTQLHTHIGSGGEPESWRQNIDLELSYLEQYFPDATTVSFGGGLKEARIPSDIAADVQSLGEYAKQQVEAFYQRTGRKLSMEVEPGTYLVANSGYIVTRVLDKKRTGENGFLFYITDGGMEVNARPLFYGSKHPFYVVSKEGQLLSSEFQPETLTGCEPAVIVGRCCESGDSQCLEPDGSISPRLMAEPEPDDIIVIGGAGAYCSSMTPTQYNSHTQAPEILYTQTGNLKVIRRPQTLEQLLENEL